MESKLPGVYRQISSEKFEDYMKAFGLGFAVRKIILLSKPTITIELSGNQFYFKSATAAKTFETKCTIGEEFEETAAGDRKCKSIVKWDGDKLIHTECWEDKKQTMTRYVDEEDRLVMIYEHAGVVCTRKYKRIS